MNNRTKVVLAVAGIGLAALLAVAGLKRCQGSAVVQEQPRPVASAEGVAVAQATSSAAVAQKVTVRIRRKAKPEQIAKPEQDDEIIEVEVTQTATTSAIASVSATTSTEVKATPTLVHSAENNKSDLTDASRWGIGAGLVRGVVFVDYQLVRQTIANQELSLDVQANHQQAGAGLAATVYGYGFVQGGLSLPYDGSGPVPYFGAGVRLRF